MVVPRQRAWTPLLKGYPDSRRINAVSEGAEALYCRLLAGSDDAGTYFGDPVVVRAKLLTFRMASLSVEEVDARLEELLREGLLVRYRSAGEQYLQLVDAEKGLRHDVKPKLQWPGPDEAEPGSLRVGEHCPGGAGGGARTDPSEPGRIRTDPDGSVRTRNGYPPDPETDPDGPLPDPETDPDGPLPDPETDPDGPLPDPETDPDGFGPSPNPNPKPKHKHKPEGRAAARGGATPPPADAGSPALSGGVPHEGESRAGPHLTRDQARSLLAEFVELAPLEAEWSAYLAALEAWPGQRLPSAHQARHRLEQLLRILREHGLEAARAALVRATAGSARRGPWETIHHVSPSSPPVTLEAQPAATTHPREGQVRRHPAEEEVWLEILRVAAARRPEEPGSPDWRLEFARRAAERAGILAPDGWPSVDPKAPRPEQRRSVCTARVDLIVEAEYGPQVRAVAQGGA